MASRFFTVMIVPERSSTTKSFKVKRQTLINLGLLSFTVIAVISIFTFHYFSTVKELRETRDIRTEKRQLESQLITMRSKVSRIERLLERIEQFDVKVRAITQLNDSERNLAMGPLGTLESGERPSVLFASGERIDSVNEPLDSALTTRILSAKIDALEERAVADEDKLSSLSRYLDYQKVLLRSTPSIWPVHSRMKTSAFGIRRDPYTRERVMHKGLDIGAPEGSEIFAPADGTVIWVGTRGGYGMTVIVDHGFGIQSHFAHMSGYSVKLGDKVKRGSLIGMVGNTGRSTGPHLHYEVRLNGIPQDPTKYMLN